MVPSVGWGKTRIMPISPLIGREANSTPPPLNYNVSDVSFKIFIQKKSLAVLNLHRINIHVAHYAVMITSVLFHEPLVSVN